MCPESFYPCQICIHVEDNTYLAQLDYILPFLIYLICGVKSFEDILKNLKDFYQNNNTLKIKNANKHYQQNI